MPGIFTNESFLSKRTWHWFISGPRNAWSRVLLTVRFSGISLSTLLLLFALFTSGSVGTGPPNTGGFGTAAAVKIARPFVTADRLIACPFASAGIATF